MPPGNRAAGTDQTAGDNMAANSHEATTRVVCRIFIKATPEAVWDAICPAPAQAGGYASPTGNGDGPAAPPGAHAESARCLPDLVMIGEILEAGPPGRLADAAARNSSVRSGALSVELRDTLTGYTALTVSCEQAGVPGVQEAGTGRCDWDQLLGDLKIVLEVDRRQRQRAGRARPSPRWPLQLRPTPIPQALALPGGAVTSRLTGASLAWGRGAYASVPVRGGAGRKAGLGGCGAAVAGRPQSRSRPVRRARRR
jgi:hypothetical protein